MSDRKQLKAYEVTLASSGYSDWVQLDMGPNRHMYTITLEHSGTATATVELTTTDPDVSPTIFEHPVLTDITSPGKASDWFTPLNALRIHCTSYTSGTMTLRIAESA